MSDYRRLALPARALGATLFLGNPPYVLRHHGIAARVEALATTSASLPHNAASPRSQLAGLHVHFFLATALQGRPGDVGALVTAAEWLDVNYGALVRELLLGPLGVESVARRRAERPPLRRRRHDRGDHLLHARRGISRRAPSPRAHGRSARAARGGTRGATRAPRAGGSVDAARARAEGRPAGLVELGELCHVHRGQVTGANAVWIAGAHSAGLPREVLFASVTRARELFAAGDALRDARALERVIDLPADLDVLDASARRAVERFLRAARSMGADRGFVAQNRKAWWSVGLREPAPILATYMARRPPAFVRNLAGARHINIAHGIYPREPMTAVQLDALARYRARETSVADGRTYAGGLTKFEPREMERLLVPRPA